MIATNAASARLWLRRGDVSAQPRSGLRSALAMNGFNRLDENEGRATTLSSCPAEGRPLSLSIYWVTIKTVTQHSSQKRIHKRWGTTTNNCRTPLKRKKGSQEPPTEDFGIPRPIWNNYRYLNYCIDSYWGKRNDWDVICMRIKNVFHRFWSLV